MVPKAQTPPDPKPRIFISAVSKEFGELRKSTDAWIRKLGCEPETMEIWGTEPGDLRAVLRGKIDSCKGLIQIVGDGYGAEPPTADPDFGRVSYTQFEFLYAAMQGKTTWIFPAAENADRDTKAAQLDLPRRGDHPDPAGYQAERRALQAAYRARLEQSGHLRHGFTTEQDLRLLIQDLSGYTEAWHTEYRESQRKLRTRVGLILGGLVALALLMVGLAWRQDQSEKARARELAEQQTQATATITRQLADLDTQEGLTRARAERDYHTAKVLAEALPDTDQRHAALARLEAEHRDRLEKIGRLFAQLRVGYAQGEINDTTTEFQRILNDPDGGIKAAISYLEDQKPQLVKEMRTLVEQGEDNEAKARAARRSVLIGADAAAAEGRPEIAARLYDEAVQLDPKWSEASTEASRFYRDRAVLERDHGTRAAAVPLARKALNYAERHNPGGSDSADADHPLPITNPPTDNTPTQQEQYRRIDVAPRYSRPQTSPQTPASNQSQQDLVVPVSGYLPDFSCCYVWSLRELSGVGNRVSLDDAVGAENRLKARPESGFFLQQYAATTFRQLGDRLFCMDGANDIELALYWYHRSLQVRERVLADNPASENAQEEVSAILQQLGDLFARRNQPRDAEQALQYYQRALTIGEPLLAAHPGSAEAVRYVVVLHHKLVALGRYMWEQTLVEQHSAARYAVLHRAVAAGVVLDGEMMWLYEHRRPPNGGG